MNISLPALSFRRNSYYKRLLSFATSRKGVLVLFICALSIRILVTWFTGTRNLFMGIVPDDSFYYFTIVKNILAGYGSTFDKITPTNGYHPLWMILLLPVFALPVSQKVAVPGAMALGGLIWCFGVIPLARLAKIILRTNDESAV